LMMVGAAARLTGLRRLSIPIFLSGLAAHAIAPAFDVLTNSLRRKTGDHDGGLQFIDKGFLDHYVKDAGLEP
jgi:hypothetical protein